MNHNNFRNALLLIPGKERKNGVTIIFLLAFSALLDLFSLASFLPLVIVIIKPESFSGHTLISDIYASSGFTDPINFSIGLTIFAVIFIVIKTQLNNHITKKKTQYAYKVGNHIANDAMTQFFKTSYLEFTKMDYAREMNRLSNLPLMFANNFIIPAGTVLSETIVASMLVLILAFYEVKIFVFLLLILAPIIFVFQLQRKKIKQTSQDIKDYYPRLLKDTLKAVEGLPEIKSFGKENFFKSAFNESFIKIGGVFSKDHTLHTSTARTIELMAGVCIGLMIIFFLITKRSPADSAILLSIYAGATLRIIPSFNRIFSSLLQIRTHGHVIEELGHLLKDRETSEGHEAETSLRFNEKIELRNIFFQYENGTTILKNASLVIHKGEKIIIQGRSGAGKTTLYLLLLRFIREQLGCILIDGEQIHESHDSAVRKLIGYVSQNPYLQDASVFENIAFGVPPDRINQSKIKQLLEDLDLIEWVESLPLGLHTIVGEKGTKVSGGQRQRIAIARALYHDAEILLLDEVTNQLDSETEIEVMQALKKLANQNKTILLITHRPELWNSFDSVYNLKNGQFENIDIKTSASAI